MLGAVALLASCSCTQQNGNSDALAGNPAGDSLELIGKTVLLKYSTGMMAEVSYVSPTAVHWATFENGEATGEGDEELTYQRLNGYQFFLSWIEADGSTVSQVVDLKGFHRNSIPHLCRRGRKRWEGIAIATGWGGTEVAGPFTRN